MFVTCFDTNEGVSMVTWKLLVIVTAIALSRSDDVTYPSKLLLKVLELASKEEYVLLCGMAVSSLMTGSGMAFSAFSLLD